MKGIQPTETQIQSAIMGFLRYKGYFVRRMNSGAIRDARNRLVRMNTAGTPDLMAHKMGRMLNVEVGSKKLVVQVPTVDLLYIEVKRPGNVPTSLQEQAMAELEEAGARCLVATSVEEVEALL